MKKYDRLFNTVLVRPPSISFPRSSPEAGIDIQLAKLQHEEYTRLIRSTGIKVISLSPMESSPDAVFTQDPAVVGRSVVLIGRFSNLSRCEEENNVKAFFQDQNKQQMFSIKELGRLEGGDILVTDRKIFIGISRRTNLEGANQFIKTFPDITVEAVPINAMHLMCYASYLTDGDILFCPDFINTKHFAGFNLIEIPRDEALGANVVYLGNRHVLFMRGYPKTEQILIKYNYIPIEINISEYQKADGSVSCLSLPFYKHF